MANGIRQINFYPTISYFLFATFSLKSSSPPTVVSILGTHCFCLVLVPLFRLSLSPPLLAICSSARAGAKTFFGWFAVPATPSWTGIAAELGSSRSSHRLHTSSLVLAHLGTGILFYFCLLFCFYFSFFFEPHFCADYLLIFFRFLFFSWFFVPTTFSFFFLLSFVASQGRGLGLGLGLGLVLGRSQRNYKLVRWQVALLSSCDWNSIVLPARQTDRRLVRAPCSWCVLDSFSNLSADRLHWQVCSQQIASRCNPSASSNERANQRAPAESITFLEESNSWMRQRHWVSERKIETEGDGGGDGQRECKVLKKTLNSYGMKAFCIQLTCGRK